MDLLSVKQPAAAGAAEHEACVLLDELTSTKSSPASSVDASSFDVDALRPGASVELVELIEGVTSVLNSSVPFEAKKSLLCDWLSALDTASGDLDRYAFFDAGKKYTRNLISTDNKTFTLMLLCWTAGKESPIHDHPCQGCWMRVVSGSVCETRYTKDEAANRLERTSSGVASAPAVVWINDSVGLHKVAAQEGAPAMTLHLYSPPFRTCSIWLGEDSKASEALHPYVTYHSTYGQVVDYSGSGQWEGCGGGCSSGSKAEGDRDITADSPKER